MTEAGDRSTDQATQPALVPVRRLDDAKSRLGATRPRATLDTLARAMLADVLAALEATPEVNARYVVTPDDAVAEAGERGGARALRFDPPGLNAALDHGVAALADRGAQCVLIVLGDVAGALPEDLSALFAALADLGGRGAVLARARDGGTAALLSAPPGVLPHRFGPDSAAAHREAAREAGIGFAELDLASLAIDLDREQDLRDLLARKRGAPHTRAALARLTSETAT